MLFVCVKLAWPPSSAPLHLFVIMLGGEGIKQGADGAGPQCLDHHGGCTLGVPKFALSAGQLSPAHTWCRLSWDITGGGLCQWADHRRKGNDMPSDVSLDRKKRQSGWNSILPGSFSAKGFPNTLIEVQTERTRRHLGQSGTKKKNKHKSRVGSFSLLSNNNPRTSLQVTRVRRQVQNERKKVKPRGRPGAFSVLARPSKSASLGQRRKRSAQKKKQTKIIVCS
ncbi:unnamed protein product [Coregonus sp. 'balchen']|nr:unnamed protein product [Coregonus sp. 'balchen']